MAKAISWCRTCGKDYEGCPTCLANRNSYFSYKTLCCSAYHYTVYQIVSEYLNHIVTKEEAKDLLLTNPDFDQFELDSFIHDIKKPLYDILYDMDIDAPVKEEIVEEAKAEEQTATAHKRVRKASK